MWTQLYFRAAAREEGLLFVDLTKCHRCFSIAGSWYQKQCSALKKEAENSDHVQAQVEEAGLNFDKLQNGEVLKWPTELSLKTWQRCGMTVSCEYFFITIKQFRDLFRLDPFKVCDVP
jgi:hypothetical protein